jgi:hypothetical protein
MEGEATSRGEDPMKIKPFGQSTNSVDALAPESRVVCKRTREGLGRIRTVLCDEGGRPRFLELETSDGRDVLFSADQLEPDPERGIVWALNWSEARDEDQNAE